MYPANINSQLPPKNSLPNPPRNAHCQFIYTEGNAVGIVWDDPSNDFYNKQFDIQGVDVYRSYSELGPFEKINTIIQTTGYYKDTMTHTEIEEDVSNSFIYRGDSVYKEFIFQLQNVPVKDSRDLILANNTHDMEITIDGVPTYACRIDARAKQVTIVSNPYLDKTTQRLVMPVLPTRDSTVICKYRYNTNYVSQDRGRNTYYKLVTVSTQGESRLEDFEPISTMRIEAWDYIWRRAHEKNTWILQQGGEDCHVLLRKWFGQECVCKSELHARSSEECTICYGTGIVGGYDGPFKFLMAPVDADVKIERRDKGFKIEKTSVLWTNQPPKLGTYDLILRKSGEIFIVGYVHPTEVRGNAYLQQEFNASLLSRDRIEYKILLPKSVDDIFITEKANIPDEQEIRGHTVTFENITY